MSCQTANWLNTNSLPLPGVFSCRLSSSCLTSCCLLLQRTIFLTLFIYLSVAFSAWCRFELVINPASGFPLCLCNTLNLHQLQVFKPLTSNITTQRKWQKEKVHNSPLGHTLFCVCPPQFQEQQEKTYWIKRLFGYKNPQIQICQCACIFVCLRVCFEDNARVNSNFHIFELKNNNIQAEMLKNRQLFHFLNTYCILKEVENEILDIVVLLHLALVANLVTQNFCS